MKFTTSIALAILTFTTSVTSSSFSTIMSPSSPTHTINAPSSPTHTIAPRNFCQTTVTKTVRAPGATAVSAYVACADKKNTGSILFWGPTELAPSGLAPETSVEAPTPTAEPTTFSTAISSAEDHPFLTAPITVTLPTQEDFDEHRKKWGYETI